MSNLSIALITGANKGIGLEIARQLGNRNHSVWLGCRDAERGEAAAAGLRAAGVDSRAVVLDVTDEVSIRNAVARIEDQAGRLDVLVNNAGIALGNVSRVSEEPVDEMRTIFEVNTFGPFRITQAFLPLLKKSSAPRIVMMSSGLGSIAKTADMKSLVYGVGAAGYCASKCALNMLTVKFAKELLPDGFKVNAADPGYTATDLNRNTGPRTVEEAATIAVDLATLDAMGPTGGFFHDGHAVRLGQHEW